jgi:hypothetical protein
MPCWANVAKAYLTFISRAYRKELQAESTRRLLRLSGFCRGLLGIGRIGEHTELGGSRHHFVQQLESFCHHFDTEQGDASDVSTGPVEASDKAELDRVAICEKNDWNCCGRILSREYRGGAERGDHVYLMANQIGRQGRQSIILIVRPTILDGYVLTLDVTGVL